MDEIIKVNDVSMRFNLAQEKTETLKEYTVKLLTHKLFFNEFYALKHVSFSMKRGESLALIGRNGSGKSTMLKVISGVMYPSGGSVAVNGEIAPMIELGAGFDMDLTARENIFLNGAVLGHDRDYMMEHFDRIIEFSELKDFVDVPVKNFSSGTTLLFVSHDINQVQQLCQRSIWLDHGVLRGDGPSREVCADYVRAMEAGET